MTKARIQFREGADAPTCPRGRSYWERVQHVYPFQLEVPYMSVTDLDPRKVSRSITKHFARVPFDGRTHYGFTTQTDLDKYKKAAGLK